VNETVMQGHGYYNAHSELQASNARAADTNLEEALSAVILPVDGPITIGGSSKRETRLHIWAASWQPSKAERDRGASGW